MASPLHRLPNMLIITVLGRQREVDSWGSSASTFSLLDMFWAREKPCLKEMADST